MDCAAAPRRPFSSALPRIARRRGPDAFRPSSTVHDPTCLFCKIVAGEIPAQLVREDERTLAFRDISPQAPVHVLVIPKAHVPSLWELDDPELAGACLHAAAEVARDEGLAAGWRLIANTRDEGGQEIPHLHLHVLGGRPLGRMLPS